MRDIDKELKNQELAINPYFYDALSGEFYPPQDEFGHAHILGRVAIASREKGVEISPPGTIDKPGVVRVFSYTPSWADGVESRVVCESTSHGDMLVGIGLHAKTNGTKLRFKSEQRPDGLTVLRSSVAKTPIPLQLGSDIQEAQEFVAQQAQHFFDSAA